MGFLTRQHSRVETASGNFCRRLREDCRLLDEVKRWRIPGRRIRRPRNLNSGPNGRIDRFPAITHAEIVASVQSGFFAGIDIASTFSYWFWQPLTSDYRLIKKANPLPILLRGFAHIPRKAIVTVLGSIEFWATIGPALLSLMRREHYRVECRVGYSLPVL